MLLTGWLLRVTVFRGFQFFKYHIILELKVNFTVRRHILVFYFFGIDWSYEERGGKRGKKKMDERQEEREKEGGEVEKRMEERMEEGTEERTEEGTGETEEHLEATEEACEEDERCKEDYTKHQQAGQISWIYY